MIIAENGKVMIQGDSIEIQKDLSVIGQALGSTGSDELKKLRDDAAFEWLKERMEENARLAEVAFGIASLTEEQREELKRQMEQE